MSEEIQPCVMCSQHHEQMLMLSCIHDPCLNCAAVHYCTTQGQHSKVPIMGGQMYRCAKCGEETELDSTSVVELQRVFHLMRGRKKYEYRRNLGGTNMYPPDGYQQPVNTKTQQNKKKAQTEQSYNQPYITPNQPYTPISQPTFPANPHNNLISKKAQQPVHMCEDHPEQELSYFCFTCSRLICPECAIHGSHRDHEVQTTRKAIKQIKLSLNQCGENLLAEISRMNEVREGYRGYLKDIEEENRREKESIRLQVNNLIRLLQEKQKQFIRSLDQNCQNNRNIVRGYVDASDKIIDQYENRKKSIDGTMKKDDITVLQQYSKKEKESIKFIESHKDKGLVQEPEGWKEIDYINFKQEIEQIVGIIGALRLVVRNKRSSTI